MASVVEKLVDDQSESDDSSDDDSSNVFEYEKYHIYSLIRRTIFAEKICLFDQNLLKTRGASYNRVFSRNKI